MAEAALNRRAAEQSMSGKLPVAGERAMADIVLRNLDETLVEQLRLRAVRHGRSMNAELREIVREAL